MINKIPVEINGDMVSARCPFCGTDKEKPQSLIPYENGILMNTEKWIHKTGNCRHFVGYDSENNKMIFAEGE